MQGPQDYQNLQTEKLQDLQKHTYFGKQKLHIPLQASEAVNLHTIEFNSKVEVKKHQLNFKIPGTAGTKNGARHYRREDGRVGRENRGVGLV